MRYLYAKLRSKLLTEQMSIIISLGNTALIFNVVVAAHANMFRVKPAPLALIIVLTAKSTFFIFENNRYIGAAISLFSLNVFIL